MRRLILCAVLFVGCSSKGDPTDDPQYNAAVLDAAKVAASDSTSEEETKAKLDAMLKGKTPNQIIEDHERREREKVYAENRVNNELKKTNDLMEEAVKAYDKLSESKSKDSDERLKQSMALMAIDNEMEQIKSREGRMAAAKFFHGELVGKTLKEVTDKWSSRYK